MVHVRLTTHESGQIRTPITAYQYVIVLEPPRSRRNVTLVRYNVRGYAFNIVLPRYVIASSVLTLFLGRGQAAVRPHNAEKCYLSDTLSEACYVIHPLATTVSGTAYE